MADCTASGPIGWCIGLMSAGLAAANLLVDYQMMQDGARQGLPQWFEWWGPHLPVCSV